MKIFESKWLLAFAVFLILFGNFSLWLSNNIYNANNFKSNITKTFKSQQVRDAISAEVIDRILSENPALKQIVSSPAQSAISGMLASPFLDPVIEKAAEKLQTYIVGGQNEVSIDLAPVNNVLTAISRATSGESQAPQIKNTNIVIFPANAFPNLNTWLRPITTLGPILGILGIVYIVMAIVLAENKFKKLWQIGIFLLFGSLLNFLLIPFIASLIPQYISNPNAAIVASEAYSIFTESYYNQLAFLLVISVIAIIFGYFGPRMASLKNQENK